MVPKGIAIVFTVTAVLICGQAVAAQLPPTPPSSKSGTPQPKLQVVELTHDLGTLVEGDVVPVSWSLQNNGDADLIIDMTRSSCGCTVVSLPNADKTIPPGGRIELKAEFNTKGRRGEQNKHVKIYSNDPRSPKMQVSFTATVAGVYDVDPPGIINLRSVVRGETAPRAMTVKPAAKRKSLKIDSVKIDETVPLSYKLVPDSKDAGATRIEFEVNDTAALGTIATQVSMFLTVDGIKREHHFPLRAEVVGNLTWLPKVVDASRQVLTPGKRLTPVTVRSTEKVPFQIQSVSAGHSLNASFERISKPPRRTAYSVYLTVSEDAPPGPFGTTLAIHTTSLDQPVLNIPVFGIITPSLLVDPSIVVLRPDGTDAGATRRLRIAGLPTAELIVTGATCAHPGVKLELASKSQRRQRNVTFLTVTLAPGGADPADTVIVLETNVPGQERFEIPCRIVSGG